MSPTNDSIAVLETKVGAHSGYFLHYLAQGWSDQGVARPLEIVLPPTFPSRHPDAHAGLAALSHGSSISVHLVPEEQWARTRTEPPLLRLLSRLPGYPSHLHLRRVYWARWLVMRDVLRRRRPSRALVMSLDDHLLPALLSPPPADVALAGVLFKPSFHYRRLPHHELRRPEVWRSAVQLRLLRRFLRRRENGVLTLDPIAAARLRSDFGDQVATLPEPARAMTPGAADVSKLAERLRIGSDRRSFLMLGALATRRGVHEVLAAFQALPPDVGRRSVLMLAGTVNSADRTAIMAAVAALRSETEVQVVVDERRIRERELMSYFHLADVVLVTHRRHVGSSGTLLHAAAAGRPVIATRSGLIGELVRRHSLGWTVDATSPTAIAAAVQRCLTVDSQQMFEARAAAELAAANTPERYARVLIDFLTSSPTL